MSTSPHQGRNRSASGVANDEQSGEVSRRAMLAGAVATTAVAAVGASDMPAYARTADPNSSQDMMAFLVLSAGAHRNSSCQPGARIRDRTRMTC